jgi:GNAT superfamily N-acetyltransferase
VSGPSGWEPIGGGGKSSGGNSSWEPIGGSSSTSSAPSGGGGGGFLGSLKNAAIGAGHYIAHQASVAGHTIEQMPGGLWDQANQAVIQPWWNFATTGHPYAHGQGQKIDKVVNDQLTSIEHTLNHPGENLLATGMLVAPALHGVGRVGVGAAEAGGALRAGEGLSGAGRAFKDPALLRTPRTLTQPGGEPVSLATSKNVLRRVYQAAHDAYVQKMINNKPDSVVAKYGASRMHGTLSEITRARVRMRQAVVANLRRSSATIGNVAKGSGLKLTNAPKTLAQAALELVSHNTTPEEAIIRAEHAVERGLNPELNQANIQLYHEVQQLDLVHTLGRDVGINPEFEHLARTEQILHEGASSLDTEIAGRGLRPAEQLQNRRNLPAAVTQRLKPFAEARMTPAMRDARARFEKVDAAYQKALGQEADWRNGNGPKNARGPQYSPGGKIAEGTPEQSNPYRNRVVQLGMKHEEALQRLQKLEAKRGAAKTSVPEDLLARQELLKFVSGKFGEDVARTRIGLLDQRAAQFARENDVPASEFYRRFLKHLETSKTLSPQAADLLEIQPFHGFPEEKTAKNLRTKQNPRTQKSGLPANKTLLTKEGIHFAGEINPEQWIQRVVHVMKTSAERDHAARWYEHFEPLFREEFPPEVADKIIRGFSVSQANASPSSGVASTLAALERMNKGEEVGSIGSVVADNIEKALKGEHIDSKVAAKLSDFIDALRGESTRTWMGHRLEGGAPAPIDIWGLRDLGYWDKKIASKGRGARLDRLHGVKSEKLAVDNGGSAVGARYERASEKYHEITAHLNAVKFDGRSNWTPAQAQALGWASIQRFYGQVPEDLATAITKGRTRAGGIIQRGHVAKAVEAAKEPDGGFTLNRDLTPDTGKEGFAVALAPYEERVPAAEFTPKDLRSYEARHRALLERDPSLRVGGWHNPKDGLVYLDVSRVLPTREEALAFAREHGQLSAFDRAAAAHGDWENAFPESGLSADAADAIKSAARERAQAPETYQQIVRSMAEKEVGRKPTPTDIRLTEDRMHEAAQARPNDPTSQRFLKLYDAAHEELQRRQPSPEDLFMSAFHPGDTLQDPMRVGRGGPRNNADLQRLAGEQPRINVKEEPGYAKSERWLVAHDPSGQELGRQLLVDNPGRTDLEGPFMHAHGEPVELRDIHVEPHARGQGVARALLDHVHSMGRPAYSQFDNPEFGQFVKREYPPTGELRSQQDQTILGSYNPKSATMRFSEQHAIPETVTHEALHAIRQSMPELLQRKFEARYGVERGGQWSRANEEKFVEDMLGVHNGTVTDPEIVRMYHQLTDFVPGRSFTPLTTLDKGTPSSPMARAGGPVIGEAQDPLNRNFTTGEGLLSGRHQEDVVDSVARHWHNVFRFFNTQDWRDLIAKTGSDVRRSTRDILVRVDNRTEGGYMHPSAVGKITPELEKLLGRQRDTSYTPQMEGDDAGIMASVEQYVNHLFPGRDPFSHEAQLEAQAPEGAQAPTGYKWVDSQVAGNLDVPRIGAGSVAGRFMDNLNSAVTAATVYFKIGHVTTRVLTNAATNIMQGSATPLNIKTSVDLWHDLSPAERLDALASAGTHYYESIPGAEGTGRVARIVQHGIGKGNVLAPQWWARVVDAPFRFNSLAYEVRKSAYGGGVDAFRQFQHDLKNYNGLDPAQRAEVDGVVRRANREAIAYDRLNPAEKSWLSRAIWFYPWVKGSTVWTASAMFEHPWKSAALVNQGVIGMQKQKQDFGDVPSYSYGLFQLAHGEPFPLAADFSTFNPEATAGSLLQIPSHFNNIADMANPAVGMAEHLATSTDQYGSHTNHPITSALQGVVSASPESQIAQAFLGRHADQSHREFPGGASNDLWSKTWLGEVLRMLLGPGAPRRFNPDAAHSLAQRERTGR